MLKRIFEKWFGLEPVRCEVCEVLRAQLDESNRERRELLTRALTPPQTEPPHTPADEEMKPVQSQFVPWRVKQQMLEAEDRVKARLLQDKAKEIADLEREVGIAEEVNG